MHPFETLAQPIRRRIVEMLASGEHLSGTIEEVIVHEFGVGRSAVQHHLAVLRDDDWVIVRYEENMRGYRLNDEVLDELERLIADLRERWMQRTGWTGGDPLAWRPSARGYRGRGQDPDNPWRRAKPAGP